MPRSQTSPAMIPAKTANKSAQLPVPLKIETKNAPQEPANSEICLSPSWSDHGEKERKKERKRQERENKDFEKRRKQWEEGRNTADQKAAKRLSKKPPPAAMDTQKMPAELRTPRRNSLMSLISGQPSSQEGSRRNSREEKRLSGSSIVSFMSGRRSHSEQRRPSNAPSINGESQGSSQFETSQSLVSPAAPRLPSFRWSSKKTSLHNSKSSSWSGPDRNEDELIAFAYQMENPVADLKPEHNEVPESVPIEDAMKDDDVKASNTRDINRSATEPILPAPLRPQRSAERTNPISKLQQNGHAPVNQHKYEDIGTSIPDIPPTPEEYAGNMVGVISDHNRRSRQSPTSPKMPQLHTRPSHDGSSYVHKQRMYQQQRSIAGFEDEQAIQLANEQAAMEELQRARWGDQSANVKKTSTAADKEEQVSSPRVENSKRERSLPRQPGDSSCRQSVSPSKRVSAQHHVQAAPSPLKTVSQAPQSPAKADYEQQTRTLERAGEPIMTQKTQAGKSDKILGFGRRSKQRAADIPVCETKTSMSVERASSSLEQSRTHETASKRSRIERMSAQNPFRTRRASTSAEPEVKDVVRGHARSRTASSQLLNDALTSPTSVNAAKPASTTQALKPDQKAIHPALEQRAETPSQMNSKVKRIQSPGRPKAKSDPDSAALAATYTDEIESPVKDSEMTRDIALAKTSKDPEFVVETVTGDGIVRKTSITRPRSNPHLQTQTTNTEPLPPFDFLPQLKHQPLVKSAKRSSAQHPSSDSGSTVKFQMPARAPSPSTAYKSPHAPNISDLAVMPRSPLRAPSHIPTPTFNRSATSVTPFTPGKGALAEGLDGKPIAKLFVICCKCKFWHDLPSKLYEAMALPKELHKRDDGETASTGKGKSKLVNGKAKVAEARLETAVKCPWCEHAMTTWCCAGWTTVVYLHERHH